MGSASQDRAAAAAHQAQKDADKLAVALESGDTAAEYQAMLMASRQASRQDAANAAAPRVIALPLPPVPMSLMNLRKAASAPGATDAQRARYVDAMAAAGNALPASFLRTLPTVATPVPLIVAQTQVTDLPATPAVDATDNAPAVPAMDAHTIHVDTTTGEVTAHPLGTLPSSGTYALTHDPGAFIAGLSGKVKAGIALAAAGLAFVLFHKRAS